MATGKIPAPIAGWRPLMRPFSCVQGCDMRRVRDRSENKTTTGNVGVGIGIGIEAHIIPIPTPSVFMRHRVGPRHLRGCLGIVAMICYPGER